MSKIFLDGSDCSSDIIHDNSYHPGNDINTIYEEKSKINITKIIIIMIGL